MPSQLQLHQEPATIPSIPSQTSALEAVGAQFDKIGSEKRVSASPQKDAAVRLGPTQKAWSTPSETMKHLKFDAKSTSVNATANAGEPNGNGAPPASVKKASSKWMTLLNKRK